MPSLLDLKIIWCEKLQALQIGYCPLIEKSIKEGCEGYRWVSGIPECNLTFGDLLTGQDLQPLQRRAHKRLSTVDALENSKKATIEAELKKIELSPRMLYLGLLPRQEKLHVI